MSSFKFKARHKKTGDIHELWALDDYFGAHQYGYVRVDDKEAKAMTQKQYDIAYSRTDD